MRYILMLFMLGSSYYTLTYGLHIWKKEKNKLGGAAVMCLAVLSTLVPSIVLIKKF